MSKQISHKDLAEIVTKLLTAPEAESHIDEAKTYSSFMTEIAEVVCNHLGGEVVGPAAPLDEMWYIGIIGNDSLPEDGGIFAPYDKGGELFSIDADTVTS